MRSLIAAIGILLATATGAAAADPIRIALIEEPAAPGASAADHGDAGFRLGLDYATSGTNKVRGRPVALSVVEEPGTAYRDGADIAVAFGPSEAVLALLPAASAAQRLLLVAEARASVIAGSNRYVFRTAASIDQLAEAEALALARPELNLFVAAEDTRDGADTAAAMKQALGRHADTGFFVGARLVPPSTADVGSLLTTDFEGLHDLHGGRTLLAIWQDATSPIPSIAAAGPDRFGIRLACLGPLAPNAPLPAVGFDGITSYFHSFPHNRVNAWLVAAWRRRFHAYPDGSAAEGMTAALALVAALKTAPSTETEALIGALEGLRFATPKGAMVIRKEDHQALQVLYQFRNEPAPRGAPMLEHQFSIAELSAAEPK